MNTNVDFSAAESHGIATGILCANGQTEAGFWLQELQQDSGGFSTDDLEILENLFDETRNLLVSDEFTFQPLLPSELAPIDEQVVALRNWCQGFLYGISFASPTASWSKEIHEIVKDITEFTKLDSTADDEDAESDMMELTEYLKAAVIFLHTELNSTDKRIVH